MQCCHQTMGVEVHSINILCHPRDGPNAVGGCALELIQIHTQISVSLFSKSFGSDSKAHPIQDDEKFSLSHYWLPTQVVPGPESPFQTAQPHLQLWKRDILWECCALSKKLFPLEILPFPLIPGPRHQLCSPDSKQRRQEHAKGFLATWLELNSGRKTWRPPSHKFTS